MLNRAFRIAVEAHQHQTDKAGYPYILHPLHLMDAVEGEIAKATAVLHDTIEDTYVDVEFLKYNDISDEVIENVLLLTRDKKTETYREYIQRIGESGNNLVIRIKLLDLKHNLDYTRLKRMGKKDLSLISRYQVAYTYLLEKVI